MPVKYDSLPSPTSKAVMICKVAPPRFPAVNLERFQCRALLFVWIWISPRIRDDLSLVLSLHSDWCAREMFNHGMTFARRQCLAELIKGHPDLKYTTSTNVIIDSDVNGTSFHFVCVADTREIWTVPANTFVLPEILPM